MTVPAAVQMGSRPLFGGAITIDLPTSYGDASDLRQIPDNQEVFLSPSSDTSVVVEVLALVEEGMARDDLWEAVKYHFGSIAHDNAALQSTILTPAPASHHASGPFPPGQTDTPEPIILTGTQSIHKYSHDQSGAPRPGHESDQPDQVFIGVALWRVWIEPEPGQNQAAPNGEEGHGGTGRKKADVVCSVNVNMSAEDGNCQTERATVEDWWLRSVGSLRILDWNLFGDVEE